MKTLHTQIPILLLLLSIQCFAQENDNIANNNGIKKYAYQFMGELSLVQTGICFEITDSYSDKNEIYSTLYRTGYNFINNMVYKEKISVGLGIGIDCNPLGELGFPVFADFRYYFTEKRLQPFINVGVGVMPAIHYGFFSTSDIYKPGLYLNCSSGFKYDRFQLNAGINIRTYKWIYDNSYENYLAIDFFVKLGFNSKFKYIKK